MLWTKDSIFFHGRISKMVGSSYSYLDPDPTLIRKEKIDIFIVDRHKIYKYIKMYRIQKAKNHQKVHELVCNSSKNREETVLLPTHSICYEMQNILNSWHIFNCKCRLLLLKILHFSSFLSVSLSLSLFVCLLP